MKKYFKIIIIITFMILLSSCSKQETISMSLTNEEYAYLSTLQNKEFVLADYSGAEYIQDYIKHFKENYNINIKTMYHTSFDDFMTTVINKDADFAIDLGFSEQRQNEYGFIYSQPYAFLEAYLYYNDENITGVPFKNMTIVLRSEKSILNQVIKRSTLDLKEVVYISEFDDIGNYVQNNKNTYFFYVDNYGSVLNDFGFFSKNISGEVQLPPMHLITTLPENTKFINILYKILNNDGMIKEARKSKSNILSKVKIDHLKKLATNLDKEKTYKIFISDYPGLAFREDGVWQGAFIDILDIVFEESNLKYEIINDNDYDQEVSSLNYNKLINNSIDIFAPISVVSANDAVHTSAVAKSDVVLIKKATSVSDNNSIAEVYDKRIGVSGNAEYELIRGLLSNKEIQVFANYKDMINALENEVIDYAVCTRLYYNSYINETKNFGIIIDEDIGNIDSIMNSFAFQNTKEGKLLSNIFSYDVSDINIDKQISKYSKAMTPQEYYRTNNRLIMLFSVIMLSSVIIVAYVFYRASNYDNLTKIRNRRSFNKTFKSKVPKDNIFIFIDLNKFKYVNDVYGHVVGDDVLKSYANKAKEFKNIKMYRVGGDEFVILDNVYKKKLDIDEIIKGFSQVDVILASGITLSVTASIGYMKITDDNQNVDIINEVVDSAMYQAKKNNEGPVKVDKEYYDKILKQNERITIIKKRFENHEFSIKFMPMLNTQKNEVYGYITKLYHENKQLDILEYYNTVDELGLDKELDILVIHSIKELYDKLVSENNYNNEVFILDISSEGIERIVRNFERYKDLLLFIKDNVVFRLNGEVEFTEVSKSTLIEFSKKGLMLSIDNFDFNDTHNELSNRIEHFVIDIKKNIYNKTESNNDNLTYLSEKVNKLHAKDNLSSTCFISAESEFFELLDLGITYLAGSFICDDMTSDELSTFVEEKDSVFGDKLPVKGLL